jgi:hypothetical protein
MTVQNYLIIQNNVVTNIVVWNGNTDTWQPPKDSIQFPASEIISKEWVLDYESTPMVYVLKEEAGMGKIGFIWDGSALMTNQPQPSVPEGQID